MAWSGKPSYALLLGHTTPAVEALAGALYEAPLLAHSGARVGKASGDPVACAGMAVETDGLGWRIAMTTSVRATDAIPKVPNAGQLERRDGIDVQVMHNGVVVEKDCYYGAWMTEVISQLRGHHEPQEEMAFDFLLGQLDGSTAPVMVELGAYWGYYSLWLKSTFPDATVLLVEPDPRNLRVGQRNFDLNALSGRWVQAAVGSQHSANMRLRCESDGMVRSVRTITLDGLMANEALPRVDLLLCDVQGAEVEMLKGAVDAIRDGRVRFMLISTHWLDDRPLIHQSCMALVERLGGYVIADHSIPESCSGDGLIVATFRPEDRDLRIELPIVRARDSELGELEWQLARRVGWRGVVRGVGDVLPSATRKALVTSRVGAILKRRAFGRRAVLK
jgi:FkbM family methyltransferase